MKIHRLFTLASAFGIGLLAASCNQYDRYGHRSTGAVVEYRTGHQIRSLPPRYRTVTYGGTRYYHHNNVYYRPHGRGYIVVDDPRRRPAAARSHPRRTVTAEVGVVRTLPRGYRVRTHGGVRYYQHGDSYYQATRGGYRIVPNPYRSGRRGWR